MIEGAPTVVIVDDAADLRMIVRTQLRLSGRFTVAGEGATGLDAIALAAEHKPDLMLLDVSMPEVDGLEALPRVIAASPQTRVVMFTGFDERGLGERARALGAVALLEKSVSVERLADDLLALLDDAGLSLGAVGTDGSGTELATAADTPTGRSPQEVLSEHLERFGEVFEQAAIGMATMTLTGRIVRANRAMSRLMRAETGTLVGVAYGELMSEADSDALAKAVHLVSAGTRDVVQHEHGLRADPGRRMRTTIAAVRDTGGRALYLFVQAQDVTDQRAAEEALRQSEERFRLLIESVSDYAIFMLDPGGHVVSWNAGAQRLNGYAADEILGKHFRTFYPPEKQAERHPEHELELALRDGRYQEEGWRVRNDGSRLWANVVITAVHDATGKHVGFAKVTRDVTAQRAAEEALRQSEERFRLLVDAVRDYAIFMLDTQGHIVSWNAGAQRLNGYTADEILGAHFRVFYPPEKQAIRHPEHELELAVRDGRYEEEGWRVRKDGGQFWATVLISAVYDAKGDHIGFAKVTRDITERRKMLEEQIRSAEALASANRDLGAANERLAKAADEQAQFLAVTAHELRSPIGVISGSADLLHAHWAELDETERVELFESMAGNAGRLRGLLEDLLIAARLEAGAVEVVVEEVPVAAVVANAVIGARRQFDSAQISMDVPPDLVARADPGRLSQAIDNLISNALSHGEPPVDVSAVRHGGRIRIRVSDSGAGVRAELAPRLFDRFATARHRGGTGLGLFIVRELARAQGGDAWYEPVTEGSRPTFVVELPAADGGSQD